MDRALVERAQRGDRDACEQVVAGVARRLYLIAYRIVRDSDQADDAVQRTLVTIWRELRGLRDPDRFDAWTYRLLVRSCLSESRRHGRRRTDSVAVIEGVADTEDRYASVVLRDTLDRAFQALSPEHRAVLVLRHYADLTLPEIADALGVPYGTVGSRLHHATQAMRARLAADERDTVARGAQR